MRSTRAAASRRKAPVVDSSDVEMDDHDNENKAPQDETEDDITPAPDSAPPKPMTRRARLRKAAVAAHVDPSSSTPANAPPRRRTRAAASVEPSQLLSPASASADTDSPAAQRQPPRKRSAPSSRASVAPSDASQLESSLAATPRASLAPSEASHLGSLAPTPRASLAPNDSSQVQFPTPKQSATPRPEPKIKHEPESVPGTPLADVTQSGLDETTVSSEDDKTLVPGTQHSMVERVNPHETILERPMDIVVRKRAAALPAVQEPAVPKERDRKSVV